MSNTVPERGEVWTVDLDPTVGVEMQKRRPAVVLSIDTFDIIPMRIGVPLTTWQRRFEHHQSKTRIAHTDRNGLSAESAADIVQIRSVSVERFGRRLGVLDVQALADIVARLAIVVGFDTRNRGR